MKLNELDEEAVVTDPYEDDDDSPTLQRPPMSNHALRPAVANGVMPAPATATAPATGFVDEPSTDTDILALDPLADAHTVDALPPDAAVAWMGVPDYGGPDYADLETPKIPLDVAAVLLRASQDDDGSGN